eukprot:4484701-Prymnesium_polylepis.2
MDISLHILRRVRLDVMAHSSVMCSRSRDATTNAVSCPRSLGCNHSPAAARCHAIFLTSALRSGSREAVERKGPATDALRTAQAATDQLAAGIFARRVLFDAVREHTDLPGLALPVFQDLSVRCDSPEHQEIIAVAWILCAIWPIGMVLVYAALLVPCRTMLFDETWSSPLLRATSFLHRDYKPM